LKPPIHAVRAPLALLEFERLARRQRALVCSDERSAAMQFLAEVGDPYTLTVYDVDGRTSIDYGVYGAPETFLIDKNGVIRFKQIGPLTPDVWEKKIMPLARQLNQ